MNQSVEARARRCHVRAYHETDNGSYLDRRFGASIENAATAVKLKLLNPLNL